MTMDAVPTADRPNLSRMASIAALASCHDCSRLSRSACLRPAPSPRSNDNWSPPPSTRPDALTPSSRIPSPGSIPASSEAATCPIVPPVVMG